MSEFIVSKRNVNYGNIWDVTDYHKGDTVSGGTIVASFYDEGLANEYAHFKNINLIETNITEEINKRFINGLQAVEFAEYLLNECFMDESDDKEDLCWRDMGDIKHTSEEIWKIFVKYQIELYTINKNIQP